MSEGNVRVAEEIIAAWNRGESGRRWLADDVEYVNPPNALEPGTRHGIDDFERALGSFFDVWDGEIVAERYEEHPGDVVFMEIRLHLRARQSGLGGEAEHGWMWNLRDGKGVRFRWFPSREQARAALGAG
jgi:hypothetical protein